MWQSLPPLPSSAQGSTQATTRYERTSAETKPPARRSKDRVEGETEGPEFLARAMRTQSRANSRIGAGTARQRQRLPVRPRVHG